MAIIKTEEKSLINELTQGKELANQLRNHLNSSSDQSTRQFLVEKILSTYEKSLSLLNKTTFMATDQHVPITKRRRIGSLNDNCSPTSESGDQDCFNHKDLYKKRKTMPRWTEHVQICTAKGIEGTLDDGYTWRKYGQKDILGANFPRGYYRCTHRHTKNCLATKQVQRTDEDPTILEVTYRGSHSGSSINLKSSSMAQSPTSVIKLDSVNNNSQRQQQNQSQDPFVKFGTEKVVDTKEEIFSSFTFPCVTIESNNKIDEDNIFIGDLILDQNIFTMSPELNSCFFMSDFGVENITHISQSLESDYTTETFSAPTSVSKSRIGGDDLDYFSMVKVEFDSNFPFDNPEFFS